MRFLLLFVLALQYSLTLNSQSVQSIVPKIKNAIVTVYAEDEEGDITSTGSGFFISSDGIGITNFHVLDGAFAASVKDVNGNNYKIEKVIDYNPQYDLVKYKVKTNKPTKFLSLAPSLPLQGEQVINYSTPLGVFENTVSSGIVSSIRKMVGYETVIQITAPISHGSSGSPVLNRSGNVIGVATFGYEDGQSLNFAVSSLQIKKLRRQLNIKVSDMVRSPLETQILKKACVAVSKKNYNEALSNLDAEISQNGENHLAYYLRGKILLGLGSVGEGLNSLLRACMLDSLNYDYTIELARSLRRAAISKYETENQLNEILLKDAFTAYLRAINLDQERCYAYAELAYLMYFTAIRLKPINEQILKDALLYSNIAIELGHDPENYLSRAQINGALGNYGQAIIDCDDAIRYDPKSFRAHLKRADIKIYDLGNIDDGLIDAERALALAMTAQEKGDALGIKGMAYEEKAFKLLNRESVLLIKKACDCYEEAYNLTGLVSYINLKSKMFKRIDSYTKTHNSFP